MARRSKGTPKFSALDYLLSPDWIGLTLALVVFVAAGGADAAAKGAVWRGGAVRLVLVSAIAWALLVLLALAFHLWSCSSPVSFLSGHPPTSSLTLSCCAPRPTSLFSSFYQGKK